MESTVYKTENCKTYICSAESADMVFIIIKHYHFPHSSLKLAEWPQNWR